MGGPESPRPIATVDVVLLTLGPAGLEVLLAKREREPFRDRLALPGGFVHTDADADTGQTALRVLRDKTGLAPPYLEQLYTFSGAVRDPRGWSLSVVYFALLPEQVVRPAVVRDGCTLCAVERLPDLPFDHGRIIAAALTRLRNKAAYSSLPAFLLPETFTMDDLRQVYERVLGTRLDRSSFRRKIEEQGFFRPVEGERRTGAHRPAQLYRLAEARLAEFDRTI